MKLYELLKEDSNAQMPHLYLDMDGVQADFFGAWADRNKVDHWKAIKDREKEIQQLAHSNDEEVYNFFRNLAPLSGGMQIINWLHKNRIPFTVLSAPLRGPFEGASIQAKKDWLDEYNPGTSSNAIFTGEKFRYATHNGKPQVLVDDFGPYLRKWSDAGGIAVKHEDQFEDPNTGLHTIKKLQSIYSKYLHK